MAIIETQKLNLYYDRFQALIDVDVEIHARRITAIIGPSGCGKSTLLRALNRMNDLIEGVSTQGRILIDGEDILRPGTDLVRLRRKVGMVFQRPNPFPLSIFENLVYGLKVHHMVSRSKLYGIVEEALRDVLLWDTLKDKLRRSAMTLSLEEKQRLCIARTLAVKPDIILMDEPCSALDPIATLKIEETARALKERYTIVIVTHNMQQAARISDETGFMLLGRLIEFGRTQDIFSGPKDKRTEEYITGRYG
ncbi:MAG: phosphate ABC transporter ATP-binding protein PstB [Deltaproteobacteria bacterium]